MGAHLAGAALQVEGVGEDRLDVLAVVMSVREWEAQVDRRLAGELVDPGTMGMGN